MNQIVFLFHLPGFSIDQIDIQAEVVILLTHVPASEAACPLCHHPARRVHSHYSRTLQDLPCGTRSLRLLITVRRFFCDCTDCPRKIFAERLPELTSVYARRTTRNKERLAELGFLLGGKAAAALSAQIGLESSRMTILRILRKEPLPAPQTPKMLGVDEFAFRRGKTYGTLLINLENGTPVDLLPDRQATTLATWLKNHPGVQLISRDRAGEFALGAKQGAPEALQTADRFHVLRNLTETVECVLGRHRKALKQIHLVRTPASPPSVLLRHRRPDRERKKQQARAVLLERYEAVQHLVKQGLSHRAIARQLHLHRESVIRYAKADRFPEKPERPVSSGILAPYETYLRTRFLEGENNVLGLFREIVARGYLGSRMTVQRFIQGLRTMQKLGMEISQEATTKEMTPHRAVGLMLQREEDLTPEEKLALEQVCQLHPHIKRVYALFQQFTQMLRERRGEGLETGYMRLFIVAFLNCVPL
jgi:transposase